MNNTDHQSILSSEQPKRETAFSSSLHDLFAHLSPDAVEQFYQSYQLWSLRQQRSTLVTQIATLQQNIAENAEQMQQIAPSPLVLANLAQLQSYGVTDIALLDTMLERGEQWLDHTMQLLERCEKMNLIGGDYTEWCQHALEGAYNWLDTMTAKVEEETPELDDSSPIALQNESTRGDPQVTEALLLRKLMSEDGEDEIPVDSEVQTDEQKTSIVRRITRPLTPLTAEDTEITTDTPSQTDGISMPLVETATDLYSLNGSNNTEDVIDANAVLTTYAPVPTSKMGNAQIEGIEEIYTHEGFADQIEENIIADGITETEETIPPDQNTTDTTEEITVNDIDETPTETISDKTDATGIGGNDPSDIEDSIEDDAPSSLILPTEDDNENQPQINDNTLDETPGKSLQQEQVFVEIATSEEMDRESQIDEPSEVTISNTFTVIETEQEQSSSTEITADGVEEYEQKLHTDDDSIQIEPAVITTSEETLVLQQDQKIAHPDLIAAETIDQEQATIKMAPLKSAEVSAPSLQKNETSEQPEQSQDTLIEQIKIPLSAPGASDLTAETTKMPVLQRTGTESSENPTLTKAEEIAKTPIETTGQYPEQQPKEGTIERPVKDVGLSSQQTIQEQAQQEGSLEMREEEEKKPHKPAQKRGFFGWLLAIFRRR